MRASEFGGCVRAIVAGELGYVQLSPPESMQRVFQAGNEAEEKALAVLRAKGWDITRQQEEVEFAGITGHIDGYADDCVVEIKSMGTQPYAKWLSDGFNMGGLMERYKWQTSVYQAALDCGLVFVAYCRETGDVNIRRGTRPFYSKQEIVARVNDVEEWVEKGELPGCDIRPDNYVCPFRHMHIPEEKDRDELVESLGETWRELKEREKGLQGEILAARRGLEEALGDRDSVDCPRVKVTRYWAANPARVDIGRLKEAGLYDEYKIDAGRSLRLKVTLRDGDEGGD